MSQFIVYGHVAIRKVENVSGMNIITTVLLRAGQRHRK